MTTSTMGASALAVFSFQSAEVRIIAINGDPWFILSDVTAVLGFSRSRNAARILDDDEKGAHILSTPGGDQEVTIISESGVYALALKSRRPEARPFRKWVTAEVLPAIRKTGSYAPTGLTPEQMEAEIERRVKGRLSHTPSKNGSSRFVMNFTDGLLTGCQPFPDQHISANPYTLGGVRFFVSYVPADLIPNLIEVASQKLMTQHSSTKHLGNAEARRA